MLKIVTLAVLITLAIASLEADWKIYKDKYSKSYTADEDARRFSNYKSFMKEIEEHNELYAQGKSSFYMGENQFTDWTVEEFARTMNGLRVNVEPTAVKEEDKELLQFRASKRPSQVDWREKGYVTPVKDQGQCGSCYAFSATGSMEGQHFNATGKLVSLSESNIVDCSFSYGNIGCEGGNTDVSFKYVIANKGIDSEAGYQYDPWVHKCEYKNPAAATFSGFTDIKTGSEDALSEAVATVGPISVAIDASHRSFQGYAGGLYDEPKCNSTRLDHGVLVVGYGKISQGEEYYIVKNSWNTSWGMSGYIWMSRNKNNQCGIATLASYPTV